METRTDSQPQPAARTASKSIQQTERATHAFEVAGNILQPDVDVGKDFYVTSAAFVIGGYRWHLQFYPSYTDGSDGGDDDKYVSLFLELLSKGAKASVVLDVRFVNQDTGSSHRIFRMVETVFTTMDSNYHNNWGRPKLMKRSDLYASAYLRDDRLLIECDVTVINETRALLDTSDIDLPPSELSMHLAKLLQTKEGADVTFRVRRQKFRAHRIVLAARSPVFKAMLYGPVGEDNRLSISVQDMQPAIFSALLHFVYTDSLASMEDLEDEERIEFAKHLLVAADRYSVQRLKLICEGILSKGLDVQSMDAMLNMSMKYNCRNLRHACKKYIHPNKVEDAVPANQEVNRVEDPVPAHQEVNRSALTVLWNRAFSLLRYVVPRFLFNNRIFSRLVHA